MTKFIIEHLDPEVFEWNFLEYKHISSIVGKKLLIFTNVPKKDIEKLSELGEVHEESVTALEFTNPCILDPDAQETLSPNDSFDHVIIGGIMGDNPPKARTKNELTNKMPNIPSRNLGNKQMSTDTAALVTKKIIDGTPLDKINFIDNPDIDIEDGLSVNLPYRYVEKDGKPILAPGIKDILENEESF